MIVSPSAIKIDLCQETRQIIMAPIRKTGVAEKKPKKYIEMAYPNVMINSKVGDFKSEILKSKWTASFSVNSPCRRIIMPIKSMQMITRRGKKAGPKPSATLSPPGKGSVNI